MTASWCLGREATTHVLTHSLHYGLSVFEGVRAYETAAGTAIFRLQDHTNRLFNSAHIYQIPLPYDRDTLNEAQREVVRANGLASCYLRPLAFYGSEKWGLAQGRPGARGHRRLALGRLFKETALAQGIRVKVSPFARQHVNVTMPRAKVATTYANSIIANAEALQDGYDEALLLDTEGFRGRRRRREHFHRQGRRAVRAEIASALTGITRSTIHALAADLGLRVVTKRLTRDDVYIADEAFFTGTAAEVTPIREVDNRQIGASRRPGHREAAAGLLRPGQRSATPNTSIG